MACAIACSRQGEHRQSPPSGLSGRICGSRVHQQLCSSPSLPQLKLLPQFWHCLVLAVGGKASNRSHTAFFSKLLKPGQPAISLIVRRQWMQLSPVAFSWQRCWQGDGIDVLMPTSLQPDPCSSRLRQAIWHQRKACRIGGQGHRGRQQNKYRA